MAPRSPEAQAAYKAITENPAFNDLSGTEKRQALQVWKAKYDPPRQPVTLSKEPPKGPMRLVQNGKVVETPNQMVPKPLLPAAKPWPSPQKQGPPLPTPGSSVPVVNELLRGMVASPSRTAPASQGRPTLPPEFEQGLAPSSGGMLSALSQAQPFVENVLPQFALQASPLGPFAGPLVAVSGMQGANYGTQINNGQLSREDAQRNLMTDLAGTATLGPLNKLLPGNGLLQAATRNVAQGVIPAEIDEAVTGRMQDPLMMAVGMGLGAAADVYTGQSPDMAPVKQSINDAVAPPRTAQAGMAVADSGSFGGMFKKPETVEPWQMTPDEFAAQPGVLYHGGTIDGPIDPSRFSDVAQYGPAFYAGGAGTAGDFVAERGGQITPVRINPKSLFDEANAKLSDPAHRAFADKLIAAGVPAYAIESDYGGLGTLNRMAKRLPRTDHDRFNMFPGAKKLSELLRESGFDAVNARMGHGETQFAAYDPSIVVTHKQAVADALTAGKPVPMAALEPYPDLLGYAASNNLGPFAKKGRGRKSQQSGSGFADDASFGGVFRKGDEPPTGGTVPPDAPEPPRYAPEVVNSKQWYHGTGTMGLGPSRLDPNMTDIEGLFGPGVYLTDNPSIAAGYANARSQQTGTPAIYEASVNVGKVLDLEKSSPHEVTQILVNAVPEEYRYAVTEAAQKPGATVQDIYKGMKADLEEYGHGEGISKPEMGDVFADIGDALKRQGWDAYTHTGGQRTGNDPHQVVIMLDPNDLNATGRGNQVTRFEYNQALTHDRLAALPKPQPKAPPKPQEPIAMKSMSDDEAATLERIATWRQQAAAEGDHQEVARLDALLGEYRSRLGLSGQEPARELPPVRSDAAPPPPPPPIDPPAAGPAAPPPDPQRGPVTAEVVGPAGPRPVDPVQPQSGQFPDPKPTPEMGRVYGPDANNLRGEARQTIKDVARAVDNAPRPDVDPDRVAQVRETIDASLNKRKGFIRSDKLSGMSDATRNNLLTRAAEVVVEEGLDPKARIGFDVIREQAERISPEVLRDLQPPKAGETVHPAVWRAASEQIDANAKTISDIESKIIEATKNGDNEGAAALKSQLSVLENDTKRLLAVTLPTRSQNGRNLAYHRIVNQGSFSNEYWLSRAARAAGVEALDDATITKVRDITLKGQRAADAGDAAGADAARIEMAKMLSRLEKSTTLETVSAVIKAGLLTSPKTHIRNIGGNAAFQLAEELSRIPASLLDMALSAGGNGRRTISGFDPVALSKAAYDGATKGVKAGREIWRQGGTDDALKRFELPRELNSGSKWLDAYTNKVFRSLSAEDQWFKAAAIRRSLEDQAYIVARNEVKTGKLDRKGIRKRAADLVAKPDGTMMVNALAAADEATFQNSNAASDAWGSAIRSLKQGGHTKTRFVAETAVAPFVKTPTNVVARMLDYMGKGVLVDTPIAVAKRLMGKLTPEEQRQASKNFGRGLVGWGMIYLGMKAYEHGIATGLTTEEDAGTRGANQLANRPEGAIRVGDNWLQLTGVAPLGGLFVLGATLAQEGSKTSADPTKPVVNSVAAATQVMLQNPMAQGAQNVLDAVKDPLGAGERWLTGLPSMAVPTAVSDVGQMLDDSQRQTFSRASGPALNVVRQIAGKVPGVRNLLPEKQDPFGRNLPTNRAALIDPFNSKTATEATDPVVREIATNKADVNAPKAYVDVTNDDGDKRRVQLTPMQQNQYKQSFGNYAREAIETLLDDPDYQAATVKEKQAMLEEELKSARTQATEEIKATLAQ